MVTRRRTRNPAERRWRTGQVTSRLARESRDFRLETSRQLGRHEVILIADTGTPGALDRGGVMRGLSHNFDVIDAAGGLGNRSAVLAQAGEMKFDSLP